MLLNLIFKIHLLSHIDLRSGSMKSQCMHSELVNYERSLGGLLGDHDVLLFLDQILICKSLLFSGPDTGKAFTVENLQKHVSLHNYVSTIQAIKQKLI